MREGSAGGQDSRPAKEPPAQQGRDAAGGDTYDLYRRGLDLLGRGSAAAAAQLLERAAAAEPESRSVLEALARAQFDAGHYAAAAGNFRRIVEASPTDDYAQFGLGLALARTGGSPGAKVPVTVGVVRNASISMESGPNNVALAAAEALL